MPPPLVIPSQPHRRVVTRQIPGPMGAGGPAGSSHKHIQASPEAVWTVAHNLSRYPHVSVVDAGLNEVFAQVVHLSTDVTQISFLTPTAGTARLS